MTNLVSRLVLCDQKGEDCRQQHKDEGLDKADVLDALHKATGAEFDRLFLEGMIRHHGGALTMVKDLFNTAGAGQDAELFDFATDADNTQRAEIRIMESMLKKDKAEEKR